jgi:hypothetical protein
VRHLRMLGLCLVAVLAVAVAAAGTASAATPEWGQCYEKTGGKYADSNCQTKAAKGAGKYEWRKATQITKKKFSGGSESTSRPLLVSAVEECVRTRGKTDPGCEGEEVKEGIHTEIECESETNTGEISGKDEVKNVDARFFGCKLIGTAPCSNTATSGEINVNVLKGKLGYINKNATPKEVGVLLEPATKKGLFAQFECGNLVEVLVGAAPGTTDETGHYATKGGGDGIISSITPVNTMTSDFTQVFTSEHLVDENIPSKFEGSGPLKVLEDEVYSISEPEYASDWSAAAEILTNVNSGEEPAEIKA